MKKSKIFNLFILVVSSVLLTSCELDNYDGPDSVIYGGIYDAETNELVRQDLIDGAQIEYVEQGFKNPITQYLILKNEGTFRNKLMFSGTYTMQLVRGNFVPLDKIEQKVNGDTKIDFVVQPYIRIKNTKIEKNGNIVTATFNLEQTVPNNIVKIGVYFHPQPTVGATCYVGTPVEKTINAVAVPNQEYKIDVDVTSYSGDLVAGKQYYFIVGALIDAAQVQAKPNYSAPVRIGI